MGKHISGLHLREDIDRNSLSKTKSTVHCVQRILPIHCPDAVPTIDSIENMPTHGELSIWDCGMVCKIYTNNILFPI